MSLLSTVEHAVKGPVFGCSMCGQCVLHSTGLTCPMTWVRTKLELERMAAGEALEVRCRRGEALENVPRSAREAGHAVTVNGSTIRILRA